MLATEDRSDTVTLGAIGFLSGAVAWLLINLTRVGGVSFDLFLLSQKVWLAPWSLLPGAVFGLTMGLLLRRCGKLTGFRQAGYAAAALVAYCCAFHVAMHTVPVGSSSLDPSKEALRMGIGGIAAGLIGSALLGAMTVYLLKVPRRMVLGLPVLVGTVAGALLSLMVCDHTEWGWSQLILFAVWQAAYAASLAPLLRAAPSSSARQMTTLLASLFVVTIAICAGHHRALAATLPADATEPAELAQARDILRQALARTDAIEDTPERTQLEYEIAQAQASAEDVTAAIDTVKKFAGSTPDHAV